MRRRSSLLMVTLIVTAAISALFETAAYSANYTTNRSPLIGTAFLQLPLGSVKAKGWLLKQLQIQRDGLTGNAESVYPELGSNSGWLGGTAPDSNWERPTYYLRGFIPLAYTLDDPTLKTRAQKWIDWSINTQQASGYFGPTSDGDWWARMPMLTSMEDYYDATGDARVLSFLTKYFQYQTANTPTTLGYWGAARAGDNIEAVMWLYNRTGDSTLLTLMDKIKALSEDWTTLLTNGSMGDNHGVNVAEGFKLPPVWYQKSNAAADRDGFMAGHNNAMTLHGQPHYLPSATEFLAGRSSMQGLELCTIADRIFSDGVAMMILGDPRIGDITEKLTFNALPGCVSKTMRQQQYYVCPNQAQSVYGPKGIWGQDYHNGVCPSWVSGVPCCCFNWHMAWPRFVMYSWAATNDNGLAILTYSPTEVTAKVGNGVTVTFTEDTNYPFEEQIRLTLTTAQQVAFPLKVRIPEWCTNPVVKVNGTVQTGATALSFYTINRTWSNGDTVTLDFPMQLKTTTQFNNSVAIERGPLVYSLKVGENWVKRVNKTVNNLDFSEYEVKPTTSWNYGLIIDRNNPAASLTVNKGVMPDNPFDQATTPITLTARAKKVPEWTMASNGLPSEVPPGPVGPTTPEETVTLVPFGAENLRITYFPEIMNPSFVSGLTGDYFDNSNLTTKVFSRTDPTVNFLWGASGPSQVVGKDTFSVRWSGQIRPQIAGTYTFSVTSDDGRRLWVNGQQIINQWATNSGTYSGTINLSANTWYDIKLEYYEDSKAANVTLEWTPPGQSKSVIPSYCLRPALSSGQDLWYQFDEGIGTSAMDSSGNSQTGTLYNATWNTGKYGSAASFDGIDDYVAVPNQGTHNALTISAWVNIKSLRNTRNSILHTNGWALGDVAFSILSNGKLCFSVNGNSAEDQTSGYTFTQSDLNQWKHVAVVYDTTAETAKLYIDGLPDVTKWYGTRIAPVLNDIRIGGWDGTGRNFDGKIDDFRIYSRALSDAEISTICPIGLYHGLRGEYYDNADLTNLKLVRQDPNIDFSWGSGSPDTSIGADTFSTRWTGKIQPRYSETYTFYITADDQARLWINGQQIINNWDTAGPNFGSISLAGGKLYDIKLEYRENSGAAAVTLAWASASQPKDTVPQICLYTPTDAPSPSVAWYKFDETSGTSAADSSGNGKTATLKTGTSWVSGKMANAVNLNGSGGYVLLPAGIMQNCTNFTIATWVKLDAASGWARIFDFGNDTSKYLFLTPVGGSGTLRFAIKNGGGEQILDAPSLQTGVWKHVAVTLSGTTCVIYIDGIEVARGGINIAPSALGSTTANYIGKSQYYDPYLDGQIDDFRIYNWALPSSDIANLVASRPDNCINYLKRTSIGTQVFLVNKTVTGSFGGYFYIQCTEPEHTACGIKVLHSTAQTIGSTVNVRGTLAKDTNDELYINATEVVPTAGQAVIRPTASVNKHVGGGTLGIAQGPNQGYGFNTIGTLRTTWGKVSNLVSGSSMTVDDGSGCQISVVGPTGPAQNNSFVRVTGVSCIRKIGTERRRGLLTRSSDDVAIMQ